MLISRLCARHPMRAFCLPPLIALCAIAALPAHAQTASDDFAYFPGTPLNGQIGGAGWASPWSGSGAATVAGDLRDPTGVSPTRHPALAIRAGEGEFLSVIRTVAAEFGKPGTTEWFSFTVARTAAGAKTAQPPAYGGVAVGGSPSLFIGDTGSGRWGMDTSGPPALRGVVNAGLITDNVPTFLVVRADFRKDTTRLTLFQNPRPGLRAPSVRGIMKSDLTLAPARSVTITFGNGSAYTIGALRLGRSYTAVAPGAHHRTGSVRLRRHVSTQP